MEVAGRSVILLCAGISLFVSVRADDSTTSDVFRVSKGLGAHGYGVLRASVISNMNLSQTTSDFYTYDEQFKYRWEQFRLQSGLAMNLSSGTTHEFPFKDSSAAVYLPDEDVGVRGVWFGDPCSQPGFVGCIHFVNDSMQARLPRLINAVSNDTDYRVVIGDNLYDEDGSVTSSFYRSLSQRAQSVIEVTVPGNHDFWYAGSPLLRNRKDPFGDGFLQWYAQDSLAGRDNTIDFLDLSVDPDMSFASQTSSGGSGSYLDDEEIKRENYLPVATNFISYHKIGNVGFLGYSGGHSWEEQEEGFNEACSYFGENPPSVIYVIGHWNEPGLGCAPGMQTPAVYEKLKSIQGCDVVSIDGDEKSSESSHGIGGGGGGGSMLRYVAGHKHCNRIIGYDESGNQPIGYLLGGTGVLGSGCDTFGFAYMDTTQGQELVVLFSLADDDFDDFDVIVGCFEEKGIGQCLEYGEVWRNTSFTSTD